MVRRSTASRRAKARRSFKRTRTPGIIKKGKAEYSFKPRGTTTAASGNKVVSKCKANVTPIGKRIKIETVCTIRRKSK